MIPLIFQSWRHRRARLVLLLVGALVMSVGLGYLLTLHETVAGTIEETVEQRWRTSYDILVRSNDPVPGLEDEYGIIEPNALVNLAGGITVEQWQAIRQIDGVDVAAPIANLGQAIILTDIPWAPLDGPAVYRVTETAKVDDGLDGETLTFTSYVYRGDDRTKLAYRRDIGLAEIGPRGRTLTTNTAISVPISAIDPIEEARLVALDQSVVQGTYLDPTQPIVKVGFPPIEPATVLPVIASVNPSVRETRSVVVERLAVEGKDPLSLIESRGADFLAGLEGTTVLRMAMSPEQVQQLLINQVRLTDGRNGWSTGPLLGQPGPVVYRELQDPSLQQRWPTILEPVPQGAYAFPVDDARPPGGIRWRLPREVVSGVGPRVSLKVVGLFDAGRLNVALDPLNELPMETYRPPTAIQRLDEGKRPVNPPRLVLPMDVSHGVFTGPPVFLTTIQAAEAVTGEAPISAIRIKVAGAATASEDSQRKLDKVAAEIRRLTGLRADITAGSSPRRVLLHLPGWEGDVPMTTLEDMLQGRTGGRTIHLKLPGTGYVEQPWVQKGAGIALIREVRLGRSVLVVAIMVVAGLFVLVTSFISAEGWRRDLGVLTALGLRPAGILRVVTGEALFFGLLASVTGLSFTLIERGLAGTTPGQILLVAGLPIILFAMGSLPAAMGLMRASPAETLRSKGTDSSAPRFRAPASIFGLTLTSLGRRPWRNLLTLAGLATPAALAGVVGYIALRLRGQLFLTWLGEYVALQVGPAHYLTVFLASAMAVIITIDSVWLKVRERAPELSLLGSLGAPPRAIYAAVVLEGCLLGLAGGLVGSVSATLVLFRVFASLPPSAWIVWALSLAVPTVCGALAAQPPARAALAIAPAQGIKEE